MLLLDQNISFRAVRPLRRSYQGCIHVSDVGLNGASDTRIRAYARVRGLAIVTFDQDHLDLAVIDRRPPKVILLTMGNTSTMAVSHLLLDRCEQIKDFLRSEGSNDLVLELP